MLLVKENSDEAIVAYLMSPKAKGYDKYDPKAGVIFQASPCDTCGGLSAHANEIKIESISNNLHNALVQYFTVRTFIECPGYDDDGNEICENCG